MKAEQLNFISYIRLLKMLILASELVDKENTMAEFALINESIESLNRFLINELTKDYNQLIQKFELFFADYGNIKLKNELISVIDSLIAKFN
jgi:hypothetical protein